jgi:hypothetical protein
VALESAIVHEETVAFWVISSFLKINLSVIQEDGVFPNMESVFCRKKG